MKLKSIKQLTGKIVLKSGLHIGAGDAELHIGGTDSSVVKHPKNQQPYIPGSSLKGKIRSLLELTTGLMDKTNGRPIGIDTYNGLSGDYKTNAFNIIKLFGAAADEKADTIDGLGTTRLSFADCFVSKESENEILSEVKAENSIDRVRSTAITPRFIERVPQGIKFDFSLSIKEFENDDTEELLAILCKGMRLLEQDALGGSGSRGYGKIKFEDLTLDGEPFTLPEKLN